MKIPESLSKLADFIFLRIVGGLHWDFLRVLLTGRAHNISTFDYKKIKAACEGRCYIMLTRKKSHLTTYLIALGNWFLTGRIGYWSHASFVVGEEVFEALGDGVQKNSLMYALKSDSVVLLKPKGIQDHEWQSIMAEAADNVGKQYDSRFDLGSDDRLSCIEYVWDALREVPGCGIKWPKFMHMVIDEGNVTPQMLYDSGDFEVVLEIRR